LDVSALLPRPILTAGIASGIVRAREERDRLKEHGGVSLTTDPNSRGHTCEQSDLRLRGRLECLGVDVGGSHKSLESAGEIVQGDAYLVVARCVKLVNFCDHTMVFDIVKYLSLLVV
jgi:hypothetical protein